ncbi:MAG: hypothetical protein K2O42_00035 [Oscillospiraceae bacterium]|nr:hypothetical protein [Oscillospiraceae bacterium]
MNETVDPGMILEFLLKSLGVFTVIFLIAVLTPWMAKHVDSWIADYKKSHGRKKSSEDPRLYAVRSIYELPPEKPEKLQDFPEKKSKKAVVIKKRK